MMTIDNRSQSFRQHIYKTFLIDCPVVLDTRIKPVDVIAFTHPHFLGASNLYHDHFGAEVWIHTLDAENPLARPFPFDRKFTGAFAKSGLEAHPIGGHTPGFTAYIHADALFVCDLVFRKRWDALQSLWLGGATRQAGVRLGRIIENRDFAKVCAWNYVTEYASWRDAFKRLIEAG